MPVIRKRQEGNGFFYYLTASGTAYGKKWNREKYLGKIIPQNIGLMKKELMIEIDNSLFTEYLQRISWTPDKRLLTSKEEIHRFALSFTTNSLRISGSQMTQLEVTRLIDQGRVPGWRSAQDVSETRAYFHLILRMIKDKRSLSAEMLLDWHWRLFKESRPEHAGLLSPESLEKHNESTNTLHLGTNRSKFYELFRWYTREGRSFHPVMIAGIMLAKLYAIEPFSYGGGRIGRLVMNYLLHSRGLPMLNIPYDTRTVASYFKALNRATAKTDVHEFLKWFLLRYKRQCIGNYDFYKPHT